MKIRTYRCNNCNQVEEELFNDSEEVPVEVPCTKCDGFMEDSISDNLCQTENFWGHNDKRV